MVLDEGAPAGRVLACRANADPRRGKTKLVTVSVTVPNDREEVYKFLDVLANHEPFADHVMIDWQYRDLDFGGPEKAALAEAWGSSGPPSPVAEAGPDIAFVLLR
jgi:hypothetical protein